VDFFSLYFYTKEAYVEKIISALTTIGQIGFGKDASVGKGRFHLISDSLCELKVKNDSANAIYTLGNCYLKDIKAGVYSYETFTRFGKHGDILAITGNPFKNPVVTARQGALLINPDGELLKNPTLEVVSKGFLFILKQYIRVILCIYPSISRRSYENSSYEAFKNKSCPSFSCSCWYW